MDIGILLIVIALVLFLVGLGIRRRRPIGAEVLAGQKVGNKKNKKLEAAPPVELATAPRPRVAEMHVVGEQARVTFDVPLAEHADEIMGELLIQEAVEVVREKRHSLPMNQVTEVVALAGRGGEPRVVGRAKLDAPGVLPPPLNIPSVLHLSHIGYDPLQQQFSTDLPEHLPDTAFSQTDELPPLGRELRLPKAIELGLRAQGIDPAEMRASQLVTGTLSLFGYTVIPGIRLGTFVAEKGGSRTYIREDHYQRGDYSEVEDMTIREFMVEFMASGADRGLLVSEKYAPFEIHEKERREPRVRFVTRERLQRFVDSLALN